MKSSTRIQILRRAPRGGMSGDRDYRGGQFISSATWEAEKRKALSELPKLVDGFGTDFQFLREVYEQQAALRGLDPSVLSGIKLIPSSTVAARMKARIRSAYHDAFALGKRHAGNLTTVSGEDAIAIKSTRIDEFQYLRGFLADMDAGTGRMPYETRADYYTKAARELFWLGFVLGDLSPNRRILWHVGPTEHCDDCLKMANTSPWPIDKFLKLAKEGTLPQSGKLKCLGYNCRCSLSDIYIKEGSE